MRNQKFAIFAAALTVLAGAAEASQLDLGNLANFNYSGRDELNDRNTCSLVASPIRSDFAGRPVQDYRIWTDNRPGLNFNLRLKGANRLRDGRDIGGGRSEFSIDIDTYTLVVVGDNNNPANLYSFRFLDNSGVSGRPTTMIQCQDVRGTPRQ